MKNWLLLVMALLVAVGLVQAVPTQAAAAFYVKTAVAHSDGTTTPVYTAGETMSLEVSWTYTGAAPAAYKVPDPFKITESKELTLKTAEGETAGTLTLDAAAGTVIAKLNETVAAGTAGTMSIPVSFNKEKLTKTGAYTAAFPSGEALSFTVTEAAAGAIKILAVSASDEKTKLAGSVFTIVDETSKVVAVLTTNSSGEASVPNLAFGTYTITQTAAPDGYAVPTDPWKVELDTVLLTKEVLHEKASGLTGALTVTAVEKGTANPIAGAEFELKTANGLFSKKVQTDAKGQASLTGLPYGTYTLSQTKTSADYVLPAEEWTIKIGRQTAVQQKIENELENEYGKLEVKLTDAASGNALQGAEYSLYDDEKKLVLKVATNSQGVAAFTSLKAGSYTLEQTGAPDGYTKSTEKTTVTIENGKTVEVKVKNTKTASSTNTDKTTDKSAAANTDGGTLPQTGDESSMVYMFGGALLAAGAVMLLKKGKRA